MDVDAGAESYVDCGVQVRCEKDYTLEVFEFAEEDYKVRSVRNRKWEMILLDTSSFRSISAGERSAMNTSASELLLVDIHRRGLGGLPSRRMTASHSVAISKTFLIFGPR